MNKLTKEQIGLFTAVACIVMLVAFFFVHFKIGGGRGSAPVEGIGEVGWFGTITLIVAMLAPIYTLLYAFRDQKALEPLKPIFVLSPELAYALPLLAFGLVIFGMCFGYFGWTMFLYLAGAVAAYKIGESDK